LKGVLLHGGHGTRLRPLTHTGPKQLIPVAGKPISQYCLEELRDAGATEIAIILGSLYPEKVREYYGDGTRFGTKIEYIYQGEPKGLAQAVGLTKDFVADDSFIVYLGDNLLKGGIAAHAHAFASAKPDAMVLLSKVTEPQRFGVAKFDAEGNLEALTEKPKKPPSPYALVGVYFFTPVIFDAISKLKPSWRGELEITDAIQSLLSSGRKVRHSIVQGWWKDTGTVQDILDSNTLVLDDKMQTAVLGRIRNGALVEGRVQIDKDATVESNSIVRGPAYVGPHSTVGPNTYLGPYTSVGTNCRIVNSEIEGSVVLDGVEIWDVKRRITSSIIGAQSKIVGANERPSGYKLIIGEQSSIRV
jgi:glucose-1-phosphate thymidylyltransferase